MPRRSTPPSLSLPALYVRHVVAQVQALGVDVDRWLQSLGLDARRLEDAEFSIDLGSFRALVHSALEVTKEPALGLLVGQRLSASTHGLVGFAVMNASTVGEALAVLEQFLSVRTNLLSVAVERGPREVHVRFTPRLALGAVERPVLEAVVMSITSVLTALTAGGCGVLRVAFGPASGGDDALARALLRAPVRYGAHWSGFSLARAVLDLPVTGANRDAFEEANRLCRQALEQVGRDESTSGDVRRVLLEARDGFPSLEVVARLLHVSVRTLHRRLEEEGTSFRALVDELRHRLALEYLRGGASVQELAFRLGYSEVANFRRAFKRWEGVPPSAHRRS